MNIPDIIIAVDGYSSTGKSTFAKLVAEKYSFLYLDSGALYRGVTLYALENGLIDPEGKIDDDGLRAALPSLALDFRPEGTFIGDRCVEKEIRTLEVSSHVSPVSAIPFVRNFVDDRLHAFCLKCPEYLIDCSSIRYDELVIPGIFYFFGMTSYAGADSC